MRSFSFLLPFEYDDWYHFREMDSSLSHEVISPANTQLPKIWTLKNPATSKVPGFSVLHPSKNVNVCAYRAIINFSITVSPEVVIL